MGITSFSEKILLNSTFLDLICPTNCEKKKVQQTGNSIFETLRYLPKAQFEQEVKPETSFRLITKPVKMVGRVTIIAIVTLTASPLGCLCYGALAAGHLIHYSVGKYIQGKTLQERKWELITQYASATRKDLTCLLTGLVAGTILAVGAFFFFLGSYVLIVVPLSAFKFVGAGGCLAFSALYFYWSGSFGGFDPSTHIARLVGDSDTKAALLLALEVRSKFGLVGEDAGLLNFSKADKMTAPYIKAQKSVDTLFELNEDADFDLIDLVKNTNKLLKQNSVPEIGFSYPFDANKIAIDLEKNIGKLPKQQFLEIIQDFKNMDCKIKSLKGLSDKCFLISSYGSLIYTLENLNMNHVKTYTPELNYKYRFYGFNNNNNYSIPNVFNLNNFYDSLEAIQSRQAKLSDVIPTGVKDAFSYRLSVNKWKSEKGLTPMETYELLGLKKNFSEDEMKKAFQIHQRALHPDKNKNSEDTTELFKYFGIIKEEVEKDLARRTKK